MCVRTHIFRKNVYFALERNGVNQNTKISMHLSNGGGWAAIIKKK